MNIGIDASRLKSEHATGVEHYSWQIIKGMLDEREKLAVAKRPNFIFYSREKLPHGVLEGSGGQKNGVSNVVIERKRLWTILGLAQAMKENPDQTLFVPSHTLPPKLPKKSVLMIHDVAFKYLRSSYPFLQYHYLNWSTKFAVNRATRIVVPSEATKNDLINFYNCESEKVVVIPHGFVVPKGPDNEEKLLAQSPVFAHFEIDKKTKYILFVGRLESKKNLVRLIEAFAEFSKSHPEFVLVLAGKRGFGFQKILDMVKKLKVIDKVVMPGYITEEEKFLLYKYCRFFAFPSLYEGFGFPILEAFYHQKPVMSSSVSSMPEVGGEAALYVDPYDVNSIIEGLKTLARGDSYCDNLEKLGSEQLKKFQWEKAAKTTLETLMNC